MEKTILFLLIFLVMLPITYSQIYGNTELINPLLIEEVEGFEQLGINLALAALNETENIAVDAEYYYNISNADIMIVYDFGSNKIAVAKPLDKLNILSDKEINNILDNRKYEKMLIADYDDMNSYLYNIVNDIKESLISGDVFYGACSVIKDGVCNESCYRDLDCDCGNNICEYHENYKTCPKDCKASSDYSCAILSDNFCDKNCALTDIDCTMFSFSEKTFEVAKRKRTTAKVLQIVIGSAIFMLVVILIFILEKTKGFKKRQ